MFLPQILSGVALPILTSLFADARRTNGKEMDLYHLFNQAIAWPMVAAILLSSRWILSLYGPEFRGGEMAMLLVVGTAGVCVIGQTMGTILWAKGKVWFGLAANTLWALILLLIVWRTVPAMGALGLALAYLVAYVFLLLIQALYLNSPADHGHPLGSSAPALARGNRHIDMHVPGSTLFRRGPGHARHDSSVFAGCQTA
jgi:O-antigen/teichoic acid export membrane protein